MGRQNTVCGIVPSRHRPPHVYVAASWSSIAARRMVRELREAGYVVAYCADYAGSYDWLDYPAPNLEISFSAVDFAVAVHRKEAVEQLTAERDAVDAADYFIAVLPASRSVDVLLGWAAARGKHCAVVVDSPTSPELLYGIAEEVFADTASVIAWLRLQDTGAVMSV